MLCACVAVLLLPIPALRKVLFHVRQEIEGVQRELASTHAEPLISKRYSGLYLKDPWRNKVGAAERRFKVIKRILVGEVENGKAQRELRSIGAQEIVGAGAKVEQVTRRNAWRVSVVVLCTVGRNTHSQRATVRRVADCYRVGERGKGAAAEQPNLL